MANVMQTLSDLAALAKAGFKAEELKEIIAQTKEDSAAANVAPEIVPKEVPQPEAQTVTDSDTPKDTLDYRKMYEDTAKELDAIKSDLIEAQKLNSSKDVSDTIKAPTGQDAINAIFQKVIN